MVYNRDQLKNFLKSLIVCTKKAAFQASDLALKPWPLLSVLKLTKEYFQLKEDLDDLLKVNRSGLNFFYT